MHAAAPTDTGLLVVISGPSGVGKTTIAKAVRDRLDGVLSVSATTRPRSPQEREGEDYHFVTEPAFDAMVRDDAFLEHACVFGRHRYGTPRGPVDDALKRGRLVILEIDVQGALQVRRAAPHALMLFVMPPSEEALLRRLRGRARDDEAAIQRRFAEAKREIDVARRSDAYDAFIVNDDLETAMREACAFVGRAQAERRRGR
jgi:guanylate kinase